MSTKLEKQLQCFIKSGLKETRFTIELYQMLYIDSNRFIAHFDKQGFYKERFLQNAASTIELLCSVNKKEIRQLCLQLAIAMKKQVGQVYVYRSVTSIDPSRKVV